MTEVKSCPICNGTSFNKLTSCIDHTVSHETFQLVQCSSCLLVITTPRPEDDKLGKYYKSKDYISHSNKATSLIDKIYLLARRYTLKKKLNLISKYKNKGSLLDYGCGTGEFLNTCKSDGWIVNGVEPSLSAREKASLLLKQSIRTSLNEIETKHDIITLWHVLEHVPDLELTLDNICSHLNENGIIFIAVPNHLSEDALHYQNFWAGYDVPRHLWHFNQKSMKKLLEKKKLILENVVPMKLDSYYVSMLSEKYKNGEKSTLTGMVNAFIIGLKSNIKARKKGDYSSLIYIARK